MSITLTCPVCLTYHVEANSTGKDGMPNWQTTKIECENCSAKFEVDLYPKLQNDLTQAVLNGKGAKTVKLIGEITGCGLRSAFAIHHAYREARPDRPEFPYFDKTRSGEDVVVIKAVEDAHFPLVGITIDEENDVMRTVAWTADGHFVSSKQEHPLDLVNHKED